VGWWWIVYLDGKRGWWVGHWSRGEGGGCTSYPPLSCYCWYCYLYYRYFFYYCCCCCDDDNEDYDTTTTPTTITSVLLLLLVLLLLPLLLLLAATTTTSPNRTWTDSKSEERPQSRYDSLSTIRYTACGGNGGGTTWIHA